MKFKNPSSLPLHCTLEVCQNCQGHENKPSRCCVGEGIKYVGRKQEACAHFLNKHTGQGRTAG